MILKRLEMTAFGPFKDKETIDFENLANNKIFLIYGKTGSGKSTIFDAISYALYGEMTGNYRKSNSIKSMYSSKDSICTVSLIFEEKGQLYRVERTPKQYVYSSKTKKMIEKNAVANLYLVSNDNSLKSLTNKSNEVTSKVVEIIGINHKQFTQVVVLPQGQFIDILNKKGNEREELLNALLRTDKYNLLTNKLKEAYDSLNRQISDVNSKIKGLLEIFNVSTKEELSELMNSIEPEYKSKEIEFNNISKEVLELSKEIEKIIQNNKYFDLYNQEKETYEKLLLDEFKIKKMQESLNLINKIELVTPIYVRYKTNHDNIDSTTSQLEKIKKDYFDMKEKFNTISSLEEKLKDLDNEYVESNNKLQALIALKDNYNSIDVITNQINELQSQRKIIFSSITRDEEIIKIEEKEIEALEKEIDEHQEFINNNLHLEVELEKNNSIVDGYLNYKKDEKEFLLLAKEVSDLEKKLVEEEKLSNQLEENYIIQEELYNHNELYKYHSLVKDNQPCPLCGSLHHPDIIKLLNGAISKDSLDVLKNNLDDKKSDLIRIKSKIDNKKINLMHCETELENSKYSKVNIDQINKEISNIKANLEKRESVQKQLKNKKEKLIIENQKSTKLIATYNQNKERLSNINGQIDTLKIKLEEARTIIISHIKNLENYPYVVQNLENVVNKLLKEKNKIENEVDKIKTSKLNLETAISINENSLNLLLENRKSIVDSLNLILEENQLTLDIYLKENAQLTPNKKIYENEVTSYQINLNKTFNKIETYKKLIYKFEIIDVENKRNELALYNEKLEKVKEQYTDIKGKFVSMCTNYETIKKYEKSIENDIKRHNILERLYNLSSGKISGTQKMSLSKFVLSKLLEDMIIYANKYYHKFSLGRYKLIRNESIEASNSGLELDVIDSLNNSTRPVSSLSGGESFMAALALSLGMSECVSSLIGGININMVFIDEGFGTLDDEHLDQALETLTSLSSGGLMIGIISHIDELKNRIYSKVEVVKTSYGSYIK